jgi:hypothetical protein
MSSSKGRESRLQAEGVGEGGERWRRRLPVLPLLLMLLVLLLRLWRRVEALGLVKLAGSEAVVCMGSSCGVLAQDEELRTRLALRKVKKAGRQGLHS